MILVRLVFFTVMSGVFSKISQAVGRGDGCVGRFIKIE